MAGFVAIEGLDGVGKSTILNKLAERFSGHAMSTPGPALRGCRPAVLEAFAHDELAKALFYAASVSSQGRHARNLVECGEWVFMDRYWASTLAYAKARGVSAELEILGQSLIKPDITILLILNEPDRQKRLYARGATSEDVETLNPCFRERALEELRSHADIFVDATSFTAEALSVELEQRIRQLPLGLSARTK